MKLVEEVMDLANTTKQEVTDYVMQNIVYVDDKGNFCTRDGISEEQLEEAVKLLQKTSAIYKDGVKEAKKLLKERAVLDKERERTKLKILKFEEGAGKNYYTEHPVIRDILGL